MPDEHTRSADTALSWTALHGKAARLRAQLRLGGISHEAELFGLTGGGGDIICYGVYAHEEPIVDPDMLLAAFQRGSDGRLFRDILEGSRLFLHPVPGTSAKGNHAAELCALLGLRLLGEGRPDKRSGKVELLVGAMTRPAEDQVAGKAERLGHQDAAYNVIPLTPRGHADVAAAKLARGQPAEIHPGGFRGGVTVLHDPSGLTDAAELPHQDRFTE
ncbi:hypothetical protein AACG61_16120 (plasmid) [Paracoccus sp. ME4]